MSCENCTHNDVCYMLKEIGDTGAGDHFFGQLERLSDICQHYNEAGQLPESRMPLSNAEQIAEKGQAQAAPE